MWLGYFFNLSLHFLQENYDFRYTNSISVIDTPKYDGLICNKKEIIKEFSITEEWFDIRYKSYEHVLIHLSENIDYWNDEIEDFEKKYCTESEVAKARYNLDQAILNRVVCNLIFDQKFGGGTSRIWWGLINL